MKNLFALIVLGLAFFSSCTKEPSTEEKAKTAIETKLIKTLNDPESYEFVKISKLDTTYVKEHYSKLLIEIKKLESETLIDNSTSNKKLLELIKEYKKLGEKKYASDIALLENGIKESNDIIKNIEDTKAKYQQKYDNAKDQELQITMT